MKKIFTLTILLIMSFASVAQHEGKNKNKDLLPPESFDTMIIQDITYTIFGESSPVSGIKIDVTKPEATISGVFQSKNKPSVLIGFDFKGGVTDKNFSIFKGQNSFNSAFELKPSIHIIPDGNKAKYYKANTLILQVRNQLIVEETKKLTDSFYVVALIYNKHLKKIEKSIDAPENLPAPPAIGIQKKLLVYFIKKILKDDNLVLDANSSADELLKNVPEADGDNMLSTYNDNIYNTYKKYEKLHQNSKSNQISKQIENVSSAWSQKKYWWLTISPFGRTEKINEYHTTYKGADSLYFKSNYHFYYGLTATINRYRLWPNKFAFFLRAGTSVSYANNLASLSSFNYESNTPFFTYGSTETTKTKSGTAYIHDEINEELVTQFSGEIYLLPLKNFLPGLYFSSSINTSKLYNLPTVLNRENDKVLIPIEGGLVFNVNSREKDKEKSILSISFYSRFEDITDKTRTSIATGMEESKEDFLKRNLNFGLKVGIPITLPQRNR